MGNRSVQRAICRAIMGMAGCQTTMASLPLLSITIHSLNANSQRICVQYLSPKRLFNLCLVFSLVFSIIVLHMAGLLWSSNTKTDANVNMR